MLPREFEVGQESSSSRALVSFSGDPFTARQLCVQVFENGEVFKQSVRKCFQGHFEVPPTELQNWKRGVISSKQAVRSKLLLAT